MNQTCEDGKKFSFEPDFGSFDPHLGPQNFLVNFTST